MYIYNSDIRTCRNRKLGTKVWPCRRGMFAASIRLPSLDNCFTARTSQGIGHVSEAEAQAIRTHSTGWSFGGAPSTSCYGGIHRLAAPDVTTLGHNNLGRIDFSDQERDPLHDAIRELRNASPSDYPYVNSENLEVGWGFRVGTSVHNPHYLLASCQPEPTNDKEKPHHLITLREQSIYSNPILSRYFLLDHGPVHACICAELEQLQALSNDHAC